MNAANELSYHLSTILGVGRDKGKGEYYFHCPFCHHYKPKLAINLTSGKWQCWKCRARGRSILSLVSKLNVSKEIWIEIKKIVDGIHYNTDWVDEPENVHVQLPAEYIPLWEPQANFEYKHAIVYLKNRGVHMHHILRYKIGYCIEGKYANRIIVPNYDKSGKLNYFVARSFWPEYLNYLMPPVSKEIVGFENMINWNEDVVLVEGVFDAISVGVNAIPLYGKIMSRTLKRALFENKVKTVYIMLDPDALRELAFQAQYLTKNGIDVRWVQLEDKDPGDMTKEEVYEKIKGAVPMTYKNLIHAKIAGNS
jgi:DNA primase